MKTLRTIFLLCLFTLLAFADSTEILRPTADSDTGSSTWATTNCGIASYASNTTSGAGSRCGWASYQRHLSPAIWNDRTEAKPRAPSLLGEHGEPIFSAHAERKQFHSGAVNDAKVCIVYSIDSGGSWTVIRCDSGSMDADH
jgi:hypothetical protein